MRRIALQSLAALVLGALVLVPVAVAQGITTGTIAGVVTVAEDGAALPGAVITAVHVPTGTRYTAVTREDGRYRLPNVRVGGPYTLSCSMAGFVTEEKNDLFVKLGETLEVDFALQLETIEEEEEDQPASRLASL